MEEMRRTTGGSSSHQLKESVSGPNAKLHSTRENGSSSSHRQKDNVVDNEQEMITSPRSGGTAGPMHNDASQNLSSQNALDADKTTSEPLQENNPTTVIGNVSNLEAARSEPLSDDTSGNHEAVPMNEETGNERRREYRINADAKNREKHRLTPRYSNKVAGPHRRNILPLSAEEENALREGMKKFGVTVTADGRIPWIAILELYRNVFHKTRFPNDLKDKWRNIMKKEERVDS